jgi:hypothetical protein
MRAFEEKKLEVFSIGFNYVFVVPLNVLPGIRTNLSQFETPFPPSSQAPSTWYAAEAAPHKKPLGNVFNSLCIITPPIF